MGDFSVDNAMWERIVSALDGRGERLSYTYPDPRRAAVDVVASTQERGEEARLWNAWVGELRGSLALDAGCGLGVHTPQLRERYAHVLSVDGDPERLQVAESTYRSTPDHRFLQRRLDDQVWQSGGLVGRFDFIHCMQVVGHMAVAAQPVVVKTLAALLRPGGRMLLGIPFSTDITDEFCKTVLTPTGMSDGITITAQEFDALARMSTDGVLPVRHFSMATVKRLVRDAGLRQVKLEVYNVVNDARADVMLLLEKS